MVFGALRKLREGLGKTRRQVVGRLQAALRRETYLTDEFLEEVEEILIAADVGVDASVELADGLRKRLKQEKAPADLEVVTRVLKEDMIRMLGGEENEPLLQGPPHVILMVGVNGVGKTTSIAKLAHHHKNRGRKVLLAAADTFRAAAVEQLSTWADRVGVDVVKQSMGSDPAAVAFDALSAARARGHEVVIVDTAGRLQNKEGLMRELEKIARVCGKQVEGAPHETILCLDANTGQNGIAQAREFSAVVGIDGILLSKLDGSAKGGVVVAIARSLELPVRYVGTGEGIEDFALFNAEEFAEGLFQVDEEVD